MLVNVGDFVGMYYEVRNKKNNKRIGAIQQVYISNNNCWYERFKTDKDGDIIYNEKLNLYEREHKTEPIIFVRNVSYFIIMIGLLKYCLEAIKQVIRMEINVRTK